MATVFSDDFNRADNDTLGNGWSEVQGNHRISSNALRGDNGVNLCLNNSNLSTANYSVTGTSLVFTTNVIARSDATASNFYLGQVQVGYNNKDIYYYNGSWNLLGTNSTGTTSSGDVFKLSVNGSSLKLYVNGVEKVSVTHTTLTSAGYFGVRTYTVGTPSAIDDFLVEDFDEEPPATAVKDIIGGGFIPFAR